MKKKFKWASIGMNSTFGDAFDIQLNGAEGHDSRIKAEQAFKEYEEVANYQFRHYRYVLMEVYEPDYFVRLKGVG